MNGYQQAGNAFARGVGGQIQQVSQTGIFMSSLGIALPLIISVPCHYLRHEECVGAAVWYAEHTAQGMGQTVGDTE
ncbi:hypothetical protein D3C76_1135940 [compost metagenome]